MFYNNVVHIYSAGVGRTGTFITIDIALEQIKTEGVVGIYNIIDKLRHQRPQMVQSLVCCASILRMYLATVVVLILIGAIHVHS